MHEYIEREAAINAINESLKRVFVTPVGENIIEKVQSADVRPVVLCKDCKNRFNIDVCKYRGDDWFCGYGERKREES